MADFCYFCKKKIGFFDGKMNSGYGDIKISGADMTKLLSYLDSDYNPTITIRATQ